MLHYCRDKSDILVENHDFSIPLAFDAPVRAFPVRILPSCLVRTKTRMAVLRDGEKNFEDIV